MDPVDPFHFAVRCFLLWNIRCREMVDRHLIDLRSARLGVTTPPDLVSIGSISFAEYILRLTENRREWLFGFITHDAKSIKLPPEDRIIFEADRIVESWDTIGLQWPFLDIDGPKLIGLIDLEACKCPFLWQNQRHLNDPPEPEEHKSQVAGTDYRKKGILERDLVGFQQIAQRLKKAGYPISAKTLRNLYLEPRIRELWGDVDEHRGNAYFFNWNRLRSILTEQFADRLSKTLD